MSRKDGLGPYTSDDYSIGKPSAPSGDGWGPYVDFPKVKDTSRSHPAGNGPKGAQPDADAIYSHGSEGGSSALPSNMSRKR